MARRMYTIRNLKTEKVYQVDEAGLKSIKDKDWMKRYTIVDERVVRDSPTTTFLPDEIRTLSAGAASEVVDNLKNSK